MLKQTQELTWSCSDIFLNWNWTTLSGISSSLRTTLKGWKWVTLFYIYALYWLYEQRGSVSLRLQFWMFSDESVGSAMNCDLRDEANPKLIYLLVQIFYNQLFSKPIFSEYSRQWIFISWSSLMVSLFTAENSVSQRGEPHFPLGWWEEHLRKVWGFREELHSTGFHREHQFSEYILSSCWSYYLKHIWKSVFTSACKNYNTDRELSTFQDPDYLKCPSLFKLRTKTIFLYVKKTALSITQE